MSVDASTWLGLGSTHNPFRWLLPVVEGVSTGHGFLFGGSALGASIAALEATSERPVVWATVQYLSYAKVGTTVDIDVTIAIAGHQTTQARTIGHVGETEIFTCNAALGRRDFPVDHQWAEPPEVAAPADCAPREHTYDVANTLASRLDQRVAVRVGEPLGGPMGHGEGRVALWTRMPELLEISAPALGVLGDYVPMGLGMAIGVPAMSNSLDNTIRLHQVVPTEWVLLDIRLDSITSGYGHGVVHLWSDDGTLMATASQSAVVRLRQDGSRRGPSGLADAPDPSR